MVPEEREVPVPREYGRRDKRGRYIPNPSQFEGRLDQLKEYLDSSGGGEMRPAGGVPGLP